MTTDSALRGFGSTAKKLGRQLGSLPTFRENKSTPIHGWFSYTEGYSFDLVRGIFNSLPYVPKTILDPFSGSATTGVEAVFNGKKFQGYDINPAMTLIADAKTTDAFLVARMIQTGKLSSKEIQDALDAVCNHKPLITSVMKPIFPGKEYFSPGNLANVKKLRENIEHMEDPALKNLFLAGLMSILVKCSMLKRSPDLKYRPENDRIRPNAVQEFRDVIGKVVQDISILPTKKIGKAKNYQQTAKSLKCTTSESIDLIITSPPYLNGTNYIRNTKLELWIGGFLTKPEDIKNLRVDTISCSINSAQNTNLEFTGWQSINRTIKKVHANAYDKRIAPMVAHYFIDMSASLNEVSRVLKDRARAFFVIGDSAFNGVHVPTHKHLVTIGESFGLKKLKSLKLRDRRSRSGLPLIEEIIEFEKV